MSFFKKIIAAFAVLLLLSGCGYNTMQQQDEAAKAAWAEVLNQYKSRADLVPQLVETVKGYAKHEEKVFTEVTVARSKVGSVQLNANELPDEAALKQYNQAQGELSSALSRLLVVSENYPQLKADQNFRELQAQLEGRENRVNLARKRFIDAVQAYNTTVRSFPSNLTAMVFGMKVRPSFTVENEQAISEAPKVEF
ncbi:MAG: LemA family protein [Neisseria sp.]|nr:LemA family protein [Neisseria sp.]